MYLFSWVLFLFHEVLFLIPEKSIVPKRSPPPSWWNSVSAPGVCFHWFFPYFTFLSLSHTHTYTHSLSLFHTLSISISLSNTITHSAHAYTQVRTHREPIKVTAVFRNFLINKLCIMGWYRSHNCLFFPGINAKFPSP